MNSNYRIPLLTVCLSIYTALAIGQNKPNGATTPGATALPVPGAYVSPTINYVRTWEASKPTTDPAVIRAATSIQDAKQTTQYLDGLGRPLQIVSRGLSPAGKDQVVPIVYDKYGRETLKYKPYISPGTDGSFKNNPFGEQAAFMGTQYPGEQVFYGKTVYEQSPLSRIAQLQAPGNSWSGSNRGVGTHYLINNDADAVRLWNITSASDIPVSPRTYWQGQLLKNVMIDEAGNRIIQYFDKDQRLILKKTEAVAGAGNGHDNWLCTYYVYDDWGNLRAVIPPQAVQQIKSNWVIPAAVFSGLCYNYRYDDRSRPVVKYMPGADSIEIVYDLRDRPVFTRDGYLRGQGKWMATFYDGLNRPVETAFYQVATDRVSLQSTMNSSSTNNLGMYSGFSLDNLVLNAYNGESLFEARNSVTLEDNFESTTGASFTAQINPAATAGTAKTTAVGVLSGIDTTKLSPLTYVYYDNYSFPGAQSLLSADLSKTETGGHLYPESVTAASNNVYGQITGTRIRIPDTNQWLVTTTYYDNKNRVIQTLEDNAAGGRDVISSKYSFEGQLLSTYQRHTNPRSTLTPDMRLLTVMQYDGAGRQTQLIKQLNDNAATRKVIAVNGYNEQGENLYKQLGINGSTALETINYKYNIRGWLKSLNGDYASTPGSASNWFGEELYYDAGFDNVQYNGNIAGVKWKSKSDQIARAYGYSYDPSYRLKTADFSQQNTGSTAWTKNVMDFTVDNLNYDANGNITSMNQQGMKGTTIAPIDKLTYAYLPNTNKLQGVADQVNDPNSALGDFKEVNGTGTTDYGYDINGNLVSDANKGISLIRYNYLNLPDSIVVTGKGIIQYQYDALGKKLKKTVTDNSVSPSRITTTTYFGNFIYKQDSLQFVINEEGRIRPVYKAGQPVNYVYDYFVKDHLGDTRLVLTEQTDLTLYAATMENAGAAKETALFSNINETRTGKPVGYPDEAGAAKNEFVAKLNGNGDGKKIGPSLVLRVMAGDTVQIGVKAFYKSNGPKEKTKDATPENMVAALALAFGGNTQKASHGGASLDNQTPFSPNFYNHDYQHLKDKGNNNQPQNDRPRAYLNYVLFDDQFKMVDNNSGVKQMAATPDELQTLVREKMAIAKSGFLYVYTSNESPQDVYFDNLLVTQAIGPVVEETHYYPFGLTMAGISSNAVKGANYPENRYKYNGKELQNKEFNNKDGLEWYDYGTRMYDQQIGRWMVLDPLAYKYFALSPYAFVGNNPIRYTDPNGMEIIGLTKEDIKKFLDDLKAMLKNDAFKEFRNQLERDGRKLKKITKENFDAATKSLNEDQKAFATAVYNTINSKDEHVVEYATKTGDVSVEGSEAYNKSAGGVLTKTMENNDGKLKGIFVAGIYGGVTVKTDKGSHSIVIEGLTPEEAGKDYLKEDKTKGGNPVGRPGTAGHEVFGHGRTLALPGNVNQHINAIRMENLILRVMGQKEQRTGESHADKTVVDKPSALPQY